MFPHIDREPLPDQVSRHLFAITVIDALIGIAIFAASILALVAVGMN